MWLVRNVCHRTDSIDAFKSVGGAWGFESAMKIALVLFLACGACLLGACGGGTTGGGYGGGGGGHTVATHFSVTAPASVIPGAAFNFTVTALDASNNVASSYSGTVHFTSTDAQASLQNNSTLTHGIATFPATLKTAGSQTITATDTLTASITGNSNSIFVGATSGPNAVPFINQPLSPAAMLPGGPGFTLTVNGTGFVSGSVVTWNGSARATIFTSESKLTATIPAADIASFDTAAVTVVNPGPGGGTSNLVFFEITRPTSSVALGTPASLSVGSSPNYMAIGDLNGDGKLDLVVANYSGSDISVLLGNGDGTFQAAVNYGAGSWPLSIGVGDFNGDGKLDLAVVNTVGNNVSVLLGNGDGTFQPAVNYAAGSGGQSVAIGDLNRDGKLDLVVANNQSNNVSVLLGNGDGTFQAAVNYAAGAGAASVAVGDFNGDGKLDLAVANSGSGYVSILLGNGDGTFQAAVDYVAGNGCQSIVAEDFNGDGKLDLVVANNQSNNVSVLLGKGDGTLQAAQSYPAGTRASSVAVGDFNGDGILDLAVGNRDTGGLSILLGIGDGTFLPAVQYDTGTVTQFLAAGDFNRDGRLDVVVSDGTNSTVSILLQPSEVSGPNATWSFPELTFGNQKDLTVSPAQAVMLVNYGTATLNITSIAASANFGETNSCASSLAPGASCPVLVTFSPGTQGTLNGTLAVTDNAAGSPQTVELTGTCSGQGCTPQGGACFGPDPNRCCPAPYLHHSYCSNPTGWGTCVEE